MTAALDPARGTVVDSEDLMRLRHLVGASRRPARRRTAALPGPIVTRRRGRGSEIDDVRLWAHGDDVRHIDRNATARTGTPHVRTFRDERDETTLLVADFRPSMLFGSRRALASVAAAEILAMAGWRAVAAGGRVALATVAAGEPILVRPAPGERAMTAVIGGLDHAHAAAVAGWNGADPPLAEVLDRAGRLLRRGGTLVLASRLAAPGDDFEAALQRLTVRVSVRVALLSDAFERVAPAGVYPFVDPDGRSGVRVVGAGRGRTPGGDDRAGLVARLARLGVAAIVFPVEDPPEAALRTLEDLHGDGG